MRDDRCEIASVTGASSMRWHLQLAIGGDALAEAGTHAAHPAPALHAATAPNCFWPCLYLSAANLRLSLLDPDVHLSLRCCDWHACFPAAVTLPNTRSLCFCAAPPHLRAIASETALE